MPVGFNRKLLPIDVIGHVSNPEEFLKMGDRIPNLIEGKKCVVAVRWVNWEMELVGVFETFDKYQEYKKIHPHANLDYTICEVNRPLV